MDDNDQPNAPSRVPDLLTEDQICERWPQVFGKRLLRRARQAGEIEFYDLDRGPRYSEAQLVQYLERRRKYPKPVETPQASNPVDDRPSVEASSRRTTSMSSEEVAKAESDAVTRLARNIGKMPSKRR